MFKKLVLIAVVLTALMVTASPAFAARGTYYVWKDYPGTTEIGTQTEPFKTFDKAIAAAQANPDGGYIYNKGADGRYVYVTFIQGVNPPGSGAPLSTTALFALLVLASLLLVAIGWFLMRRSRTLPSLA